jgi:hypothetical protein
MRAKVDHIIKKSNGRTDGENYFLKPKATKLRIATRKPISISKYSYSWHLFVKNYSAGRRSGCTAVAAATVLNQEARLCLAQQTLSYTLAPMISPGSRQLTRQSELQVALQLSGLPLLAHCAPIPVLSSTFLLCHCVDAARRLIASSFFCIFCLHCSICMSHFLVAFSHCLNILDL